MLEQVLLVDVGKLLTVVDTEGTPLKIDLSVYRENWRDGTPVTTIEGEIRSTVAGADQYVTTFGNPDHDDGFVANSGGTWGNERAFGQFRLRAAFLPTDKPGRVRMKLVMHVGHVEPWPR